MNRNKVAQVTGDLSNVTPAHSQVQCRICLDSNQDLSDPIICACRCTGSIKYVHTSCIKAWILRKRATILRSNPRIMCELCAYDFRVSSGIQYYFTCKQRRSDERVGLFLTIVVLTTTTLGFLRVLQMPLPDPLIKLVILSILGFFMVLLLLPLSIFFKECFIDEYASIQVQEYSRSQDGDTRGQLTAQSLMIKRKEATTTHAQVRLQTELIQTVLQS